ncbi:uncharacterized protein LOC134845059 [Symsagittifera roscoffensis]|uniref:uncharacterized protein LOC134845059 n=1 Tax=Symsagittifera roscoffensis TaxID=84072 RepID=UPI00307B3C7C
MSNNNKQLPSFNTSTKPASMALKTQGKTLRDTRKQTNKLEQESKNMEERLNDLKMLLNRDRMERSTNAASANANIWGSSTASSHSGTHRQPAAGVAGTAGSSGVMSLASAPVSKSKSTQQKENMFPKRVKVLKDIPISEPPKGPDQIMAFAKMMDRKPLSGNYAQRSSTENNPMCPSCSKKHVTVICTECQDYFCSMCFAKGHLKGEAKKHKSIPYDENKVPENLRQSLDAYGDVSNFTKDGIKFQNVEYSNESSSQKFPKNEPKNFEMYDEEASAASFQEALKEWRQAGSATSQKSTNGLVSTASNGITTSKISNKSNVPKKSVPKQSKAIGADNTLELKTSDDVIAEFQFKEDSSLTYAEKLLLKKSFTGNGRNESFSSRNGSRMTDTGAEVAREDEELNVEISEVRENINRYFSPRNTEQKRNVLEEIEITEVFDEDDSLNGPNETTLCSVMEPDFELNYGSQLNNMLIEHQKPKSIEELKARPHNSAKPPEKKITLQNSKKSENDAPKRAKTPASSNQPNNSKSKTPRTPKTPTRTSKQKSNYKQEANTSEMSRPTSAMSLTREPTIKLAEIAKLPKSGIIVPTADVSSLFMVGVEQGGIVNKTEKDHFTRNDSNINTSTLITIRKSKAPWRPGSSLQDKQEESSKTTADASQQNELREPEGFQEFENEIMLLENMGRESTRNKTASSLGTKQSKMRSAKILEAEKSNEKLGAQGLQTSIALGEASDDDDDEKTLDDLEYELACNTGRLNEDGSRMDRITQDLQGILNDLEVTSNDIEDEDDLNRTIINEDDENDLKFTLSINEEMEKNYASDEDDDEDDMKSVRNL